MNTNYIQEMTDAADEIIRRNGLSQLWKNREHVIDVAKNTKNINILNDIFDTFIKYEETVDIGIYCAIRDNAYIDKHLAEEIVGCHAKLAQPTLAELNDMETYQV